MGRPSAFYTFPPPPWVVVVVSKSDNKMNNILRNYPSHNYIKIHPIALFHEIFSEEHTLESFSIEIEHHYMHARHGKRDLLQLSPHYFKIIPCSNMDFTLDNSFNLPPPAPPPPPGNDRICDHNAMLASVPTRENFPLHHWCSDVRI